MSQYSSTRSVFLLCFGAFSHCRIVREKKDEAAWPGRRQTTRSERHENDERYTIWHLLI